MTTSTRVKGPITHHGHDDHGQDGRAAARVAEPSREPQPVPRLTDLPARRPSTTRRRAGLQPRFEDADAGPALRRRRRSTPTARRSATTNPASAARWLPRLGPARRRPPLRDLAGLVAAAVVPRRWSSSPARTRSTIRARAARCGARSRRWPAICIPRCPGLYADGTAEAVPYLVFEHVDGDALDDELDEHGTFEPIEVALLAAQVLAALRTVHARGLAHVDIKPDNVMLRDGRAVLARLRLGARDRCTRSRPAS